jgi:hypothetical protein
MSDEILTIAAGVYAAFLAMSFTKWGIGLGQRAALYVAFRRAKRQEGGRK